MIRKNRKPPTANQENFKSSRIVVGTHAISEALLNPDLNLDQFLVREDLLGSVEYKKLLDHHPFLRGKTKAQKPIQLDQITPSHQGAILLVKNKVLPDWNKIIQNEKSIVLFLDGLEDPHNLGAILRTAWLSGVDAIVCPENHSVKLSPAVHKVASGGVEHVPVEFVNNFRDKVEFLKENDYWIYGLSHRSTKNIFQFKYPNKIAWFVGAEDKGLRKTSENLCDELVLIPQVSSEASYNASVATGMALLESLRQTRF